MKNSKKGISAGTTLAKCLRYINKYSALLILSLVLAAIGVAVALYIPVLVGKCIDMALGEGMLTDLDGIYEILVKVGILAAVGAAVSWIMNVINNKIAYNTVRDLRRDAFSKINRLPLGYLDTHPQGEIVSRVINDAETFADGLLLGFSQLFTGVLTIVGTLGFMIAINPAIAVVVVVLTPLSLFTARFIAKKTYGMFTLNSKIRGEQTAFINETISGGDVVCAFSREDDMCRRFDEINTRKRNASLRATFFSSITNPSTRFINSVVYAAVALVGALTCIGAGIPGVVFTVGQLSCFLNYANQYTKPFNEISGVVTELQNALACAARVFDFLSEAEEVKEQSGTLPSVSGRVEFKNVSFSYVKERPLIENLNLTVTPGQRVAIVGPTGCGKTTLINLLMRFYDVDEGVIEIDGTDIRAITRENLRSFYGMVLQETWLKTGTVAENISMAKPDATREEIIATAKAVRADGFIRRLPNGYDTRLTENGAGLSVGQKQLLCIARVMLCLPPILILDEATSSIDTRTERKITQAFERMMKGRTSFIVAHRLSTVRDADIILVMRDGHIIEKGNHAALLAKGGDYARLYHSMG